MLATTNMGLRAWDQPTDLFSHFDLAQNWQAIDLHDHGIGKGLQIPATGIANSAITAAKLAQGSIDATKVQDGVITDADLASPSSGVYRTILATKANFQGNGAAGAGILYFMSRYGLHQTGTSTSQADPIAFDDADYIVAGKTAGYRILVHWQQNTTAIGTNATFGLYSYTTIGSSSAIQYTPSAILAGSSTVVTAPGASSVGRQVTASDFAAPADDQYCLGVTFTANPANNSWFNFEVFLQVRNT